MEAKRRPTEPVPLNGGKISTRETILDGAEALFADHGYYGASTHDVAAAVGVKQSLIAYHFGSKENLYREVISRRAKPFTQLKLDALAKVLKGGEETVSLEAILRAFIHPVFEQLHRGGPYRAYVRLLSQGAHLARSPTLHESHDRIYFDVVRVFRDAIMQQAPGMTEEAAQSAIDFIHGAVGSLTGAGSSLYISGLGQPLDSANLDDETFELWVDKLVAFSAAGCRQLAAADKHAPAEKIS